MAIWQCKRLLVLLLTCNLKNLSTLFYKSQGQISFLNKENSTAYCNKMPENITPLKPQIGINPEYARDVMV
jgi:hypothetical protein